MVALKSDEELQKNYTPSLADSANVFLIRDKGEFESAFSSYRHFSTNGKPSDTTPPPAPSDYPCLVVFEVTLIGDDDRGAGSFKSRYSVTAMCPLKTNNAIVEFCR